jgi:hypothetical protein
MLHGEERCRVTDISEDIDVPIFMVDWTVHRESPTHFSTGLAHNVGKHLLGSLLFSILSNKSDPALCRNCKRMEQRSV